MKVYSLVLALINERDRTGKRVWEERQFRVSVEGKKQSYDTVVFVGTTLQTLAVAGSDAMRSGLAELGSRG